MDLDILKKKISSYRTPKGRVTNLPDELLAEILHAWEQWTGPSSGFYRRLNVDQRKLAKLMGKAKQLKREGAFDGLQFAEAEVETSDSLPVSNYSDCGIQLVWNNQLIKFGNSDLLLDFLKKVA